VPWVTAGKGKGIVSTSVPAENVEKVKEMTQNYKDFRNAQKEIKKVNGEIDKLIQEILQMKECDINEVLKR
jgi:TolA-binding protein